MSMVLAALHLQCATAQFWHTYEMCAQAFNSKLRPCLMELKTFIVKIVYYKSKMSVCMFLTRSLPGTSILVLGTLFSYAGDDYTRLSLFVAQRTQIQLGIKADYKHL